MKVLAITQARYGSSRLPGKVLKTIDGKSILQIHLERILTSKRIDKLIVATTFEKETEAFRPITEPLGVDVFRGSTSDVLDRFYQAARQHNPLYVVRLTSDCPLIDGSLIDEVIRFALENNFSYASNTLLPTFPDGEDVEVFRFSALEEAWRCATLQSDREHVTPYIWRNSSFHGGKLFTADCYKHDSSLSEIRLTVDQQEDFEVIKAIIEQKGTTASWLEYARLYQTSQTIREMNKHIIRNEGFLKSRKMDQR